MDKQTRIIILLLILILCPLVFIITTGTMDKIKDSHRQENNKRIIEEYYQNKYSIYEEENPNIQGIEVLFLGDSLTDGCDLKKYYSEYQTTNRGIGGDTSSGLLNRMKISCLDAKPQVVVLLIGGNDILGGKEITDIYANYEKIIQNIKTNLPETKIIWCSLTALGNRWAKHNDTMIIANQRIKLLSNKYDCYYVDLFSSLYNLETNEIYKEYTVEGVHFTDEGYKVVSSKIKEVLNIIFNK